MKNRLIKGIFTTLGVMLTGCLFSGCVINGNSIEYVDADKYKVCNTTFDEAVSEIEIDWVSGSVTIEPSQSGSYEIEESADKELKDDNQGI